MVAPTVVPGTDHGTIVTGLVDVPAGQILHPVDARPFVSSQAPVPRGLVCIPVDARLLAHQPPALLRGDPPAPRTVLDLVLLTILTPVGPASGIGRRSQPKSQSKDNGQWQQCGFENSLFHDPISFP
jgi:hypothetical protein